MKVMLIMLLLLSFIIGSSFATDKPEEIVLNMEDGVSWKSVFDAGFRPTHIRDGRLSCRQIDVQLGVRLQKNGETLHLGRGDIEFTLVADHEVALISFYGREKRTSQYGEEQLEKFAQIFEKNLTQKGNLEYFSNGEIEIKNAHSHAKIGAFRLAYRLRHSFNKIEPVLEDIIISPAPSKERKRTKWLEAPIQPPAGYEHLDLTVAIQQPTALEKEEEPSAEKLDQSISEIGGIQNPPKNPWHWRWLAFLGVALAAILGRYLLSRNRFD